LRFPNKTPRDSTAKQTPGSEIRAPMTGKVIKLEVNPGDPVSPGDLVAALEAMKMEYRLEAQRRGNVARVLCRAGDLVEVGALLVVLEPEPEA
jgi:biotin carboxyl carrier protein